MNEKVLRVLEYHKIIDQLTQKATSEPGKRLAAALLPMTDPEKIRQAQTQTGDALGRLFAKGSTSFGSNKDLGMSLKSLEVGSVLSIAELLRIASFLENVNRIKAYGRRDRDDIPGDSLDVYFDSLEPLTPLANEINRCILSEEEIADDLESGAALSPEGLRRYIAPGFEHWFLLDAEKNVAAQGVLRSERKEYGEFPETCRRLLPPEGEVLEYMQWDFLRDAGAEGDAERYDVLVGRRAGVRSPARESVRLWLYKDLTAYYRGKYPEAGVRAVVICHKADI